jgi:hypothetical protein
MGALKIWHIVITLICLAVVVGGVMGIVALIRRR